MKLDNIIAKRTTKEIYRDGDKVIKLFEEGYSKSDILNEALNHARVEEISLNIPGIIEVTKIDNRWGIVIDFIEGKTLAQMIKDEPDKIDEHLDFFVDLQLKIHDKRSPLLNKVKDKMHMKISQTDLDATTRYDLHTRLEGLPKHKKVCHGDFNPTNIIIKKDGTPYVIDWSHATQGNASHDAATTYMIFCLQGETKLAEIYLEKFCLKSDTAKQYVQTWLSIVAAARLLVAKPKEKELLMGWVDIFDYQ